MNEQQTQTVSVRLAGQSRAVVIERLSPQHCWFICDGTMITARFKTGRKLQIIGRPQVCERNGLWFFPAQYKHNRNITPVGWYDEPSRHDSKW